MSMLNRRNALTAVATLPALAAPAALAVPAPDPILAAIAKHRECYKAAEGMVAAREKLETSTPHVSEYIDPEQPNNFALAFDRQCAANPEFERAVEVAAKAMQTEYEAGQELLHTAPATVAGAIAALHHALECSHRDENVPWWGRLFTDEGEDVLELVGSVADGLSRV
jgi:hypothetical protein